MKKIGDNIMIIAAISIVGGIHRFMSNLGYHNKSYKDAFKDAVKVSILLAVISSSIVFMQG
jgi:hypothetical protein